MFIECSFYIFGSHVHMLCKSHMLCTSKNFVFSNLRRKKNLLHKVIEGLAPSSAPSVFSPEKGVLKDFGKLTGKL